MVIIFSSRILSKEEAVNCLHGKALVQCENMQTITRIYLYP